jgi:hypothetical protein
MAIRYQLRVTETDCGEGKRILKKDLPKFIKNAKRKKIPIVGLPGLEPVSLSPYQNFYIITIERR